MKKGLDSVDTVNATKEGLKLSMSSAQNGVQGAMRSVRIPSGAFGYQMAQELALPDKLNDVDEQALIQEYESKKKKKK